MASKLKLNSNAGGSVSFTVDDTLTTDDEFVMKENYGIEYGSNANGNYIKYPDGTLICSGVSDGNAATTATGSIFISGTLKAITFPSSFVAIPIVTIGAGYQGVGSISCWGQVHTVELTLFNYSTFSAVSGATGRVNWIAIGRWK